MTPAARLSAAIEVVADVEARRRPAGDALKDWGLVHRFAGSSDRAAIAGLVYDALRRKSSSAWLMGEAGPRAAVIGMLRRERELDMAGIEALCSGERFAPPPLTRGRRAALPATGSQARLHRFSATIPSGSSRILPRVFGDDRAAEGAALASRAPLDLRVNTLKAEREEVLPKLAHLNAEPTQWSPLGLRVRLSADAKNPAIHAEPTFLKGMIEIQDEGSQLAAAFAGAKPGEQVLDLCRRRRRQDAGAGGGDRNRGQIYATDIDKRQLAPIHDASRAPARATSRSGRRGARQMCSPILPAASISR